MNHTTITRISFIIVLITCSFLMQSFVQPKEEKDDKPTNLKVLPKNMSKEEVISLMKVYSKSLGVKCNFCHAASVGEPPITDFASDVNPHKAIARKMIKMVNDINKKHIDKITPGHSITCVTCHMGNKEPILSVDSLMTK